MQSASCLHWLQFRSARLERPRRAERRFATPWHWGRKFMVWLCVALAAVIPAMALRYTGARPDPLLDALVFGAAILAAGFMLSWAAETAEGQISAGLILAGVALISVLPEYAVDIYYAYRAGQSPDSNYLHGSPAAAKRRRPAGGSRPSCWRRRGAVVFAGRSAAGLTTLISDKINQWTLLVGMLPLAMTVGAGALSSLPLDARQHQEFFLTAGQSLFGLALLLRLRLGLVGALALARSSASR